MIGCFAFWALALLMQKTLLSLGPEISSLEASNYQIITLLVHDSEY
jgi:hypothetical protein